MRAHLLAVAALFATMGFGQELDKTFSFTHPASPAEIDATVMAMRTVADLRNILPDRERQTLAVHGPPDKVAIAEWLFHELDGSAATAEYKIGGEHDEVVTLFRLSPAASTGDITQLITAIKIGVDFLRVAPLEGHRAIVARAPSADMAAAVWLVRQLSPYDGAAPTADSPAYPLEPGRGSGRETIRIFRMASDSTIESRLAMLTAVRVITAMQRIIPFDSQKAVIFRGASDQMTIGEWLMRQWDQPSEAEANRETAMAVDDGVVRIFYLAPPSSQENLAALATQLRTGADLRRVFPYPARAAVVVRGRPDQVQTAEALVAKFTAGAR